MAITPSGLIDFEHNTASWGGSSKAITDLVGNAGGYNYNPANLTANGYEGEAYFALKNEALSALIAGTIVVFDSTVTESGVVKCDLADAGYNTDYVLSRGSNNSAIFDGNGGPDADTSNGEVGRGKSAYVVLPTLQAVVDNGGSAVTCFPTIPRDVEPTLAGFQVDANCIMHSITFYSLDTYLQAVST